jgi:uncharacterized membrane protein YjfL (UPF0719 family)
VRRKPSPRQHLFTLRLDSDKARRPPAERARVAQTHTARTSGRVGIYVGDKDHLESIGSSVKTIKDIMFWSALGVIILLVIYFGGQLYNTDPVAKASQDITPKMTIFRAGMAGLALVN